MPRYRETRVLPYERDRLFDLIADVERYPEFLPWWHAARVRRRDGNAEHVEQLVGPAIARFRFASTTVLERPVHIHTTSNERPFRHLEIHWTFVPGPRGGCQSTVRRPRPKEMETAGERSTHAIPTHRRAG